MSNKYTGVIATAFEREESYTVRDKKGAETVKTRTVTVPNEILVTSSKRSEQQARKELEGFARKCKGKLKDFKVL